MSEVRVTKRHAYDGGQDAELARWPGVTWTREVRGKHFAIVLAFAGRSRFVVYPGTPGDEYRGLLNHLRDVRAVLIELGAARLVPIRSATPKRHRNRTEAARLDMGERCEGGPKRDPWAALAELQIPAAPEPVVRAPWWRRLLAMVARKVAPVEASPRQVAGEDSRDQAKPPFPRRES